jgi:Tol biopolymer transport system component
MGLRERRFESRAAHNLFTIGSAELVSRRKTDRICGLDGEAAGPEEQVLDSVYSCQLTADGIHYTTAPSASREAGVRYFDFQTRATRTITTIQRPDFGFAVSPGGRSILLAQRAEMMGDLMLVENSR